MSMIENGFGGWNLKKTVEALDKRVHELEDKLLHKEEPAPVQHEEESHE